MANTYPDIATRPGIMGYPLVNQQTSGSTVNNASNAGGFRQALGNVSAGSSAPANPATSAPATGSSFKSFMKGLFDVINPLQHIPVVGAIYRHITGDQISPAAHFIGDALYGGPIGGALAAADIAYQKKTGKDVGETVIASLTGGNKTAPAATPDTMIAQNLSKISPAAGGADGSTTRNIIWSDSNSNIVWNTTTGSPLFPPPPPTGTIGEGPASPSTPAQPVLQTKGIASTTALQQQEAPADVARKAMPPELIASKMMDGLQKYALLKQQALVPNMSELY